MARSVQGRIRRMDGAELAGRRLPTGRGHTATIAKRVFLDGNSNLVLLATRPAT